MQQAMPGMSSLLDSTRQLLAELAPRLGFTSCLELWYTKYNLMHLRSFT